MEPKTPELDVSHSDHYTSNTTTPAAPMLFLCSSYNDWDGKKCRKEKMTHLSVGVELCNSLGTIEISHKCQRKKREKKSTGKSNAIITDTAQ